MSSAKSRVLVLAAGAWAQHVLNTLCDQRPHDHQLIKQFFYMGQGEMRISVTLRYGASHQAEIFAVFNGKEMSIAKVDVQLIGDKSLQH